MSYEQKLSMQGVEVTLRLNYSENEVLFDLILTSELGEKLSTNGSVTHTKEKASLEKLEKEYEERVKEEKFSTSYLSQKLKSINTCSTFEEKKTSFIECMTYLYAHRAAIVRYTSFLDIMTNKCYEIKEGNPTDSELNGVCDKILTHFGLETDMKVYAQKKAAVAKEKEEAHKRQEEDKKEEERKKQEDKKQEQDRKTELILQKYREEVKRDEPLVKAFLKDRDEHLQLLEKVANTYDIPFAKKMYDQYMDWKVTYRGNAKNRYKRMCEFMESLPLFK
jgi:hypothetical protein